MIMPPLPQYCRHDDESAICPDCGADPRPNVPNNWCRALNSGPDPERKWDWLKPFLQMTVVPK